MKNRIIYTSLAIVFFLLLLIRYSELLFPAWYGSHSLGGNFYALDWDGGNQIIVYCIMPRGKTAYGGIRLIDDSNIDCIDIRYNDRYIAMITHHVYTKELKYYIFDKTCAMNNEPITSMHLQKGLLELPDRIRYEEQCKIRHLHH